MPGKAALVFGLLFWSALQAQNLQYSKEFPTVSKNLPILIKNTPHSYFYILRFNRKAHDLTLERRSKPGAEIISFTPLKLDSVNSELFNYSSLDYRLFEYNRNLYFVFEKNLNNRKSIYFKRIDSLGKAGGFFEICHLDRESNWLDFGFEIKSCRNGRLLIVSYQKFFNQSTKKTALLFDLENKQLIWSKILPIENSLTGYSKGHCISNELDLYYVLVKAQIVSYQRKYVKHTQQMVPVMFYDSLHLFKLSRADNVLQKKSLAHHLSALHSVTIHCDSTTVSVLAQTAAKQTDNTTNISLLSFTCSTAFNNEGHLETTVLDGNIKARLTYYDGTDSELAGDKQFEFLSEYHGKESTYHLTERVEGEVYKELILWQIHHQNNRLVNQYLLPRRLLSSETWSRYNQIGRAGSLIHGNNYHVFMAVAAANADLDPNTVNYYQLRKKSSLSNCYLLLFSPEPGGTLSVQKLHHNQDFYFIPVEYQTGDHGDAVFYFSNGKREKFAILKL